jgi:hypothetical protein
MTDAFCYACFYEAVAALNPDNLVRTDCFTDFVNFAQKLCKK